MKHYKITMKLLSPVHIGTGKDYEPINYVMDKKQVTKQNGSKSEQAFLYNFDEMDFFNALDQAKQKEFSDCASNIFALHKFIKQNKITAQKVAFCKILTSKRCFTKYEENLDKAVQKEGGGKNVFNQFVIAQTFKNPNTHKAIIPGSSIKGAISTAYQELLYKKSKHYDEVKAKMLAPTEQNLFKDLLISDSQEFAQTYIDEAKNIKRNKDKEGITAVLEVISDANAENSFTLSIKDNAKFSIKDLAKACNDHYEKIFDSIFDDENVLRVDKEYISNKFLDNCESLKINENQFLLRVGQHSGARAVTVDGIRQIKLIQGKSQSKIADEESTIWLINKKPFGWILCTYEEI